MDLATISLLVLAPLILLRGKSNGGYKHVEYKPEPQKQGSVKTELDNYLKAIEKDFEIPGIRDVFMGMSYVESRWIPSAWRYEPTGYKLAYKSPDYKEPREIFKNNPWIHDKVFWNSTSGLFQMFSANALDTNDQTAINLDPQLLLNWKYALAFAIDFAYRLNKKYDANSFIKIRYGWSSLSLLNSYNTTSKQKASEVRGRVQEGIKKSNGKLSSLDIKPNFSKYAEFQFAGMLDYIYHF